MQTELTQVSDNQYHLIASRSLSPRMAAKHLKEGNLELRKFPDVLSEMYIGDRRRITGLTERYRKKCDSIVSNGDIISKHNSRLPETISIERSNVGEVYTDHLFVDNATGKAVINLNN